jgi:hypothetical protein
MTKGLLVTIAFCAAASSFTTAGFGQADVAREFAQAQPGPQAPSPPLTAAPAPPNQVQQSQELPDIKEFGDELEKYAAELRTRLDTLAGTIKEGLKTEANANEIFDRYVGAVKEIIERIGPQSDFRKDLDTLLDRANKNAENFSKSEEPKVRELAKTMAENTTKIDKIIADANAEYARGLGTIRDLGKGRELAIALIRTKAIEKAIAAAEQYLGVVRSVIDEAVKFGKKATEGAPAF